MLRSVDSRELPLEVEEWCFENDPTHVAEQLTLVGQVKAKRRRGHRPGVESAGEALEDPFHKKARGQRLKEFFRDVEQRVPRAGTVVFNRNLQGHRPFSFAKVHIGRRRNSNEAHYDFASRTRNG